jgi:hypothetical protein
LLRQTGNYTISVGGSNATTDPLNANAFAIRKTGEQTAESLTGTAIDFGEIVTGVFDAANVAQNFLLTLDDQTQFIIDGLSNQTRIYFSIYDEHGQIVQNRAMSSNVYDPYDRADIALDSDLIDLKAGTYRIEVYSATASSASPQSFAFRMLDIADAIILEKNTPVTGVFDPANQTHIFSANLTAGEFASFDFTSGGDIQNWQILDPFGREVIKYSRQWHR